MSNTTKKRTLDAFFKPPQKKVKVEGEGIKHGEGDFKEHTEVVSLSII